VNGHSVQWLILRSRYEIPGAALICFWFVNATPVQQGKLGKMIDQELPSLVSTYKTLHAARNLALRGKHAGPLDLLNPELDGKVHLSVSAATNLALSSLCLTSIGRV